MKVAQHVETACARSLRTCCLVSAGYERNEPFSLRRRPARSSRFWSGAPKQNDYTISGTAIAAPSDPHHSADPYRSWVVFANPILTLGRGE
jgi:hypothetical protein